LTGPDKHKQLDIFLVEGKYARTLSHARDLIKRGHVKVDGEDAFRPTAPVATDARITLAEGAADYVSQGAAKLEAALDVFGFDPADLNALDIGASTGGFAQVLLERDVGHVTTIDVGRGLIDFTIAGNERVTTLEGFDARDLAAENVPGRVTAIVADVSFVSITKILPTALALAANGCWLVALIRPQLEVDRKLVGKGRAVRDEVARTQAVGNVRAWLESRPGWSVTGVLKSPIRGSGGNQEFLIGAVFDIDQELFSSSST